MRLCDLASLMIQDYNKGKEGMEKEEW